MGKKLTQLNHYDIGCRVSALMLSLYKLTGTTGGQTQVSIGRPAPPEIEFPTVTELGTDSRVY